jgi:MFS family permease
MQAFVPLPAALRPLAVRDYRLVFVGAALSNTGTWMHRVAVDWLVYQQTDSPAWVGIVSFAQFLPLALVGPFGGVLADRLDRRRILLAAQAFMMASAALLAALTLAGAATPLLLVAVSFALGLGFAFSGPTWLSTIPSLVPRELLTSAIALNSARFSAARVVGPALGGVLIAAIGAGGVFVVNAVSYLAIVIALAALHVPPLPERPPERVLAQLRQGVSYAVHHRTILWLMAAVMGVSLLAAPLVTLLPVYARDVLGGGARTLGLLTASLGVGSLIGSVALAQIGDRLRPAVLIAGGVVALAIATGGVALAPGLAVTAAAVVGTGLFRTGSVAASSSRIQALAEEAYRGRVTSLFLLSFGLAYPVGALATGAAAEVWGVQAVTAAMGVGTALVGWCLWRGLAADPPASASVT